MFNADQGKEKSILWILIVLIVISVMTTGCEPLRKKFTRKKKEDRKQSQELILEPQEYPEKAFDAMREYKLHFGLWKVWYKEFLTSLYENQSDKRQMYALNQALIQVEEMEKILIPDGRAQINKLKQEVLLVMEEFKKPEALRNELKIRHKMSVVDDGIRNKLNPQKVDGFLVSGAPSDGK